MTGIRREIARRVGRLAREDYPAGLRVVCFRLLAGGWWVAVLEGRGITGPVRGRLWSDVRDVFWFEPGVWDPGLACGPDEDCVRWEVEDE